MLRINRVMVDYLINPVGITEAPQLGWIIESDKYNVVQKTYHLQIAFDPDFKKLAFESGIVESGQSVNVMAEGFEILAFIICVSVLIAGCQSEAVDMSGKINSVFTGGSAVASNMTASEEYNGSAIRFFSYIGKPITIVYSICYKDASFMTYSDNTDCAIFKEFKKNRKYQFQACIQRR